MTMKKILLISVASLFAASGAVAQDTPAPETTQEAPDKPVGDETNLTEADARSKLEAAGYTDITELMVAPDGGWTANVMKDGVAMKVIVDTKGDVTVPPM